MIHTRTTLGLTLVLASTLFTVTAAYQAGQDTFAHAKDLYILAAYDEALVLLDRLQQTASPREATEIAGYQVFCLLALGRTSEAQKAIEVLVKIDPLYRPSEATTSPRLRAAFDDVRKGLLPAIVQELYDKAKGAFDRGDTRTAATEFDRVIALADDPVLAGAPAISDLRRLAVGFRDLSRASPATPPAAAPDPKPSSAPAAPEAPPLPPEKPAIYGPDNTDVVPPVAVSRNTPPWHPQNSVDARRRFRGLLEVVIDERGDVISATIGKSVHPAYDAVLLSTARSWKYRPATKGGVPVKYRLTVEIRLDPSRT
jgi:TonB family protein